MSDSFCDLMDGSPPGFSVHGIFHAKYWSGLPFPSPGDLPDPVIKPGFPVSPALQADSLPSESPGKPYRTETCCELKSKGVSHSLEIPNI